MLTLPWTAAPGPHRHLRCTVFAARLPVRSWKDLPRVLRRALSLRRRLARTPGLIGHAVALHGRAVWTVSAWTDRKALARFDRDAAHRDAKTALRPHLLPSTLAVWTCPIEDLPVPWAEVRARLAAVGPR
ncbi:MAG: hypothetical protein L0H84_02495 [Pseudonocardia sp.]|nr:hypothetical protein [Pseudonocardia sp.]